MWDIILAVTIGALMLLTAYLGVRVTLHRAESDQARKAYKVTFFSCAVLACILIGTQAYRNFQAQQQFLLDVKGASSCS